MHRKKEHQHDIIKWIKILSEYYFAHCLPIRSRHKQHMAGKCSTKTLRWIRWVQQFLCFSGIFSSSQLQERLFIFPSAMWCGFVIILTFCVKLHVLYFLVAKSSARYRTREYLHFNRKINYNHIIVFMIVFFISTHWDILCIFGFNLRQRTTS